MLTCMAAVSPGYGQQLRSCVSDGDRHTDLRPFQRSICNPYLQYCRKFFIVL
jgi:hypothetical protein